jgi:4'-phosphopantetheinyl transferase
MKTDWQAPLKRPCVSSRTVHIWRVRLTGGQALIDRFLPVLTCDERARGERFVRLEDRTRFIAARGALREVLGSYLSIPAESVRLQYSQTGKPSLADRDDLHFNVSHSGDLALLALSGQPVGIDVEQIKPDFDFAGISQRFFRAEEVAELDATGEASKVQRFFALWTRKEAFLKATGKGVPGLESSLAGAQWKIEAIDADPGYAAAVAHKGEELSFWQWLGSEALVG